MRGLDGLPKWRCVGMTLMCLCVVLFSFFPFWAQAQWSASFRITSQIQVSPNIYEYDVYLQNTSSQSFRLHSYQFGVGVDTAILDGGSLQVQYIDGSCALSNIAQAPFWQYDSSTATVFSNINVGSSVNTLFGRHYRFINNTAVLPPVFIQASVLPASVAGCPQPGVRIGRFRAVNSVPFGRASRPFHVFSELNAAGVTRSVVSLFLTPTTQQFLYPNATSNALGLVNWNTAGSCDVNPPFNCRDSISLATSICAPDSFWMGGVAFTVSGNYQVNLLNSFGCDSIVTLALTVSAPPVAGNVTGDDSLCVGSSTLYNSSVGGGVWSSSDPSVLNVSAGSGQATALLAGVADVVYTVAGSGGCPSAYAVKRVVVIAPVQAGVLVGADSLCVGASSLFSSSVGGGVWSSSNPSVLNVSVGSGQATALTAGLADVVYTVIGSGGCPSAHAVKRVVVTERPMAPSIVLSGTSDTLFSNTSAGNRWFRNGGYLPVFDNLAFILVPGNGAYRCLNVSTGGCNSDSSNAIIVTAAGISPLSVNSLKLYPNPNTGTFFLEYDGTDQIISGVRLWDATGRELTIDRPDQGISPQKFSINAQNFLNGLHYVLVNFSDGNWCVREVFFDSEK